MLTNRSWAEINLAALERNLRLIEIHSHNIRYISVVKADAYGHGIHQLPQAYAKWS